MGSGYTLTRLTEHFPAPSLDPAQTGGADMTLTVAVIGLGYFSQFHLDAWNRSPAAHIVGVCDGDQARTEAQALEFDVPGYTDPETLLAHTDPQVIDIVAPPHAHADLIRSCLKPGRLIICQKPFCTSVDEAQDIIDLADQHGTRIVIHENFRFQPWYREIQGFLGSGRMGPVYQARFDLRPGDGRGPAAYLDRQPAFQKMPRLLIHETAVHFIDVFRWLFGPIESVYADLRRLNPVILGEDAGVLLLHHADGPTTVFDGNRLSDHVADNLRHTMGEFMIEGEGGKLTLDGNGQIRFRLFGADEAETLPITRSVDDAAFGGGCVAALINHVIDAVERNAPLENEARDYLTVMHVSEAAYRSAAEGRRIDL